MQRAIDIMELKPSEIPDGTDFMKVISLQAQIIGNVFSTTARTDAAKLKGQTEDTIGEILDEVREANSSSPRQA